MKYPGMRELLIDQRRRWYELIPLAGILLSIPASLFGAKWLSDQITTLSMGMLMGQALMRIAGYGYKRQDDTKPAAQESTP